MHQFSKVELFAVTEGTVEEEGEGGGDGVLDEMVAIQEEICVELGLHYRWVWLCCYHGDLYYTLSLQGAGDAHSRARLPRPQEVRY